MVSDSQCTSASIRPDAVVRPAAIQMETRLGVDNSMNGTLSVPAGTALCYGESDGAERKCRVRDGDGAGVRLDEVEGANTEEFPSPGVCVPLL